MNKGIDILEALRAIDPARLDYQGWANVGMALKQEGYSADVWERWSASDTRRYHPGECLRKWDSFSGSANPVTGGTIVQYAMDQGWRPPQSDESFGWDDPIGEDIYEGDEQRVIDSAWLEEKELPEAPRNMDGAKELIRYLNALFEPAENVGYVTRSYQTDDGRHVPTKGNYDRTAGQLIEELTRCNGDLGAVLGDYDPEVGAWIRFNPLDGKGVKNENVTEYRYALVESDTLEIGKQYSLMLELKLPIAVMVHSGGKSVHAIVHIDAANYDEYRKRVDYLYSVCQKNGIELDKQNRNPSRLSRMPGAMRKGHPQYILAENVGCENFEQWKEYIEGINDDLPDMENLSESIDNPPALAPELIRGVLRHGHKLLLSGPSKAGKSFALIELCIAIAEGTSWLGFECDRGEVLYINLELDRASCLNRFGEVYRAMKLAPQHSNAIDIWNLRGRSCPMDKLTPKLIRRAQKKNYSAIIIDPIYKVITGDENSADQMSAFCNQFDKLCTELGCAVIYCHHHSKGSQGQKRSMDRASGSGVFARDPDALIDMIELAIPEGTRDERLNRIVRDKCREYLHSWKDEALPEELGSHVLLKAHAMRVGTQVSRDWLLGSIEQAQRIERSRTGWQIEGVLREFAPMQPKLLWFEYPIHKADENGELKKLKAEGGRDVRKAQSARKQNAEERQQRAREEFDEAVANANGGEPVTVKDIVSWYADAGSTPTAQTIRNRAKKFGYVINRNTGVVEKETDGEETESE